MKTFTPRIQINLKSLLICSILSLIMGVNVNGQITIEENIFTDYIGKKYKEVLYETNLDIDNQLSDILNALGPDQVYDFSNLNYIDSTVITYEIDDINPNDPYLMNENLANSQYIVKVTILPGSGGVEDTSMTYQYTSLIDGIWTVNGSLTYIDLDLDGSLDTALQYFNPPSIQVPFPVTSTSEWNDSTNLYTLFDGMEFLGSIMIDTSKVVGYGTLITPIGSVEALRVHNKQLNKNPFLPIVDESNDYDFVTENDMVSASIVVEDGRAFYSVRSLIGTSSTIEINTPKFVSLNVSPNPSSDLLNVKLNMLEAGKVDFSLIGADGSVVFSKKQQSMTTGTNEVMMNISDIPTGLYYLRVRLGNFVQHSAISKI